MMRTFTKKTERKTDNAILFIDGNNFYHGLRERGIHPLELNFEKFSRKLVLGREWAETRYYIGEVKQEMTLQAQQREFFSHLEKFENVNSFFGRIEKRLEKKFSKKLQRWLNNLDNRTDISVPPKVVDELRKLAGEDVFRWVEKAVDVMIATDMVSMAHKQKYDVAYLLGSDGDFTHAIKEVKQIGKKVFVASPLPGYEVSQVADTFIPLNKEFFHGCWMEFEKKENGKFGREENAPPPAEYR